MASFLPLGPSGQSVPDIAMLANILGGQGKTTTPLSGLGDLAKMAAMLGMAGGGGDGIAPESIINAADPGVAGPARGMGRSSASPIIDLVQGLPQPGPAKFGLSLPTDKIDQQVLQMIARIIGG